MATAELDIGSILSVCLCVCVSVQLFAGPFFDDFYEEFNYDFKKNTLQKGALAPISVGEAERFGIIFGATLPRSLHSPQMATAAPPPPSA